MLCLVLIGRRVLDADLPSAQVEQMNIVSAGLSTFEMTGKKIL